MQTSKTTSSKKRKVNLKFSSFSTTFTCRFNCFEKNASTSTENKKCRNLHIASLNHFHIAKEKLRGKFSLKAASNKSSKTAVKIKMKSVKKTVHDSERDINYFESNICRKRKNSKVDTLIQICKRSYFQKNA